MSRIRFGDLKLVEPLQALGQIVSGFDPAQTDKEGFTVFFTVAENVSRRLDRDLDGFTDRKAITHPGEPVFEFLVTAVDDLYDHGAMMSP